MKPVLLIDDDRDYLEEAAGLLREEGFTVYVASDGVEGLNVLASAPDVPGLILLDSMMPHMSGEGFLRAMRPTHPNTIVIVVSAHEGKLPLADGVLPKPVSLDDLLSVAREFCSGTTLPPRTFLPAGSTLPPGSPAPSASTMPPMEARTGPRLRRFVKG